MGLFGTPEERTAKRELGEAQKELDQSLRSRENGAEALRTLAKQIKKDAVIAKHGRVALYTDRVATPSGVFFLTPEVSAVVDTAGAISSRFTVTRFALMGPFALAMKKKKDQRELFLYIDAPTGQHMEPCRPDDAVRVRMFASQITNAARSSELTGDRPERLENLRLRYEKPRRAGLRVALGAGGTASA